MAMFLNPEEDGHPLTTSDGTLVASSGMSMPDMFGVTHPFLSAGATPIGPSTWSITRDPVWAPLDPFNVTLMFLPRAGAPFDPVMITYTEGATIPVPFHRLAMPTPPPASFSISWSDLDGRRLPDGDEIVLSTHPRGLPGSFVELETSAQVPWWKSVHLVNPLRNVDAQMVRTDGPSQNHVGILTAVPSRGTPTPDPVAFRGILLVLHKPKFLGTDTAIYQLDMNMAPYLAGPTTFHFLWRRQ
jgi:hypothetical protein